MGTKGAILIILSIFILAYTALVILWTKREKEILKNIAKDISGFVVADIISIVIWAVSPRVAVYGLDWFIITVYIFLFRIIREINDKELGIESIKKNINVYVTPIILAIFLIVSGREVASYAHTSFTRQNLIKEALEEGKKEVVVPRFYEKLSHNRYNLNYLNEQITYDMECYIKFYGTRVIVSED